MSTVTDLLHTIRRCHGQANGHSWRRLNISLRDVLRTAIYTGIRFEKEDFTTIADVRCLRFEHWCGVDNATNAGESFYRLAVQVNNISACIAFEKWRNRKPFIFHGERLCIGKFLLWNGERHEVTSFSEDGSYIVLVRQSIPHTLRRLSVTDLKTRERDERDAAALPSDAASVEVSQ